MSFCLWTILIFTGVISSVWASEELYIVHAPSSVKFTSSEPIHSSYISDIFSALLSYTVPKHVKWNSLSPVNPLRRPEAVFTIEVTGFDRNVDLNLDGTHFILENKGDLENQYDILAYRTQQRFPDKRPILLHLNAGNQLHSSKVAQPVLLKSVPAEIGDRLQLALDDSEIGQTVKEHTFNTSRPGDAQFLVELATLKALINALSQKKVLINDGIPDVYWVKIEGLRSLIDQYGRESYQVSEGLRLLRQVLAEVKTTIKHVYDDQVAFSVITEDDSPTSLTHRSRSLLEFSPEEVMNLNKTDWNLAYNWDPMFPVIFSISTFLVILISLAILGIAVGMWNMDPGRDSIIYRMTSQRMKKD